MSLLTTNCLENAPLTFGCWAAGGCCHLLKLAMDADELRDHLTLVRPRVVVVSPEARSTLTSALPEAGQIHLFSFGVEEHDPQFRSVHDLLEDSGDASPWGVLTCDPEDPVLLLLTGGTTGRSKTVALSHAAVKSAMQALQRSLDLEKNAHVCAAYFPFSHVYSMVVLFCSFLRQGTTLVVLNTTEAEAVLHAVQRFKVRGLKEARECIINVLKTLSCL